MGKGDGMITTKEKVKALSSDAQQEMEYEQMIAMEQRTTEQENAPVLSPSIVLP